MKYEFFNITNNITKMKQKIRATLIVGCLLSILHNQGLAISEQVKSKPNIFENIGDNTLYSFKGKNILFHFSGAILTYSLSRQYVDYEVHTFFNKNPSIADTFSPVAITGTLLPPAAGLYLYFSGGKQNNIEKMAAGCAGLQASLITFVYISILKGITGRVAPNWEEYPDMQSKSTEFNFGFVENGIFWGWPSGHTGNTVSFISALIAYYPEKTWLKIGGYAFSLYTAIGVSAVGRGGMHWFSDGVSAVLMSYAIGHSTGKYYRKKYRDSKITEKEQSFYLVPVLDKGMSSLSVVYIY